MKLIITLLLVSISAFSINSAFAQNDTAPPALGEQTKGTPAVSETAKGSKPDSKNQDEGTAGETKKSLLGDAKITEYKRENGQVYRVVLENSMGGKQYMEETDSDGNIESSSSDIQDTPNLPKWKIGSW